MPTFENKFKGLEVFEEKDLIDIESRSVGLTKQEMCDYWAMGIVYDNLPKEDKRFFDLYYNKAQTQGKMDSISNLFKQQGGRNGKDACIDFLIRHAEDWNEQTDTSAGSSKSYRFIMD